MFPETKIFDYFFCSRENSISRPSPGFFPYRPIPELANLKRESLWEGTAWLSRSSLYPECAPTFLSDRTLYKK